MSDFVPRPAVAQVARLARLVTGGPAETDAQLLDRFVSGRDEAAFRTLLERHAPLVLGICRRTLGQAADADDAFQATFLVLARSANRVRKPEALGCWLHGVARRVAARLRTRQARRARLPDVAARTAEPADAGTAWRDLQAVLDDELGRLPGKYRDPFVLCCLNDLTHEAAAARLGVPVGTVKSRLTRARDRLRARLARRGLAPAAAGFALTVLAGPAPAVPTALLETTMFTVFRDGSRTAAVALADEVLRGAMRTKLAAGLALIVVAVGVAWAAGPGPDRPPVPPDKQAAPAAVAVDAYGDPLPAGAKARLGSLRLRHMHTVRSVAFTTGGDSVITRSWDNTSRVWSLTDGKEKRRVSSPFLTSAKEDPGEVVWAVIAPDGRTGLSYGKDGVFCFTDLETGRVRKQHAIAEFPAPGALVAGPFTPDGKLVATLGQGTVRLWDVRTGDEIKSFPIPRAGDLVLSPDGKTLAVVTRSEKTATDAEPGEVALWDVTTGKELRRLSAHGDKIYQAVFSPDGKRLATGGGIQDRMVMVWDVATGKALVRIPGPPGWVRPVAFSPDGKTLAACGQDGIIRLHDSEFGKELGRLCIPGQDDTYGPWIMSAAFAPDGKRLVSVGTEKAIRVWDLAAGRETPVAGHQDEVSAVVVAPDGRTTYSAGKDSAVLVWDLTTGKETGRWIGHRNGIAALALSADGKTLVTVGQSAVVWDTATGKPSRELVGHTKSVASVALSPDGKTVATGGADHTVRLWELATGRLLRTIELPARFNYGVLPVAFAAGGTMLVTGSCERTDRGTYVWDVATGRQLRRYAGTFEVLTPTPDGRAVVGSGGDDEAVLIDPASGADPVKIPGVSGGAVAFSPDGRTLAVGHGDGSTLLLEAETGFERGRCVGHQSGRHGRLTFAAGVSCLAFAPDGRTLVTGGGDTTLLVWDVAAAGRQTEGPAIGRAEWWPALAADPAKADRVLKEMLASPADAVAELKARLIPAAAPDAGRMATLVRGLGADRFAERERASASLVALGDGATTPLRTAREATTSAEVRERLDAVLVKIAEAGAGLRVRRAVECLERIRTPDAKHMLAEVAAGAPGAVRTEVARSALGRVERFP